jgi:hypothetical protein
MKSMTKARNWYGGDVTPWTEEQLKHYYGLHGFNWGAGK